MSDRTWKGGTGDFYDATQWTTGVAPVPGDEISIFAGTVDIAGTEAKLSDTYNAQFVYLGSTTASAPAQITATNATFGPDFFIDQASAEFENDLNYSYMSLLSIGTDVFAGTMDLQGATFTLATQASAGVSGGDFVLATDGTIQLTGATIDVSGRFDDEGDFTLGAQSALVNTGTINVESWRQPAFATGQESSISGGGTIVIGLGGVASLIGAVTSQTFAFAGPGGVIAISNPTTFQGTIQNYATGDIISLVGIAANSATYNATTGLLTAFEGSSAVATLHVAGPTSSGTLTVTSDGAGGAIIEEPHSPALNTYTIAAGDVAMGSNIVRATMTTAAGVPITGAGIKIGVISGSFNNLGGANADAAAGFLPANPNGTSAVTVLLDEADGKGDDEGRAMAELVHQVAPGAQLYFTTGNTDAEMASGIGSLVADGVNIIVDDISSQSEPFFQVTGPVDSAIQSALGSGVSYFTSATNYGNQYYQANFTKTATTDLTGAPAGTNYAQTFSNGTNYQSILISGTTNIDLQWDAPFPTTLTGTSPLGMQMELLDAQTGAVAYTSEQATSADNISAYTSEPEITMLGVAPGNYVIAIYQTAAEAAAVPVTSFKYILFGGSSAIGDPAASNGSGAEHGHDLVPGVNTVAATSFANAPAFTGDMLDEPFSAGGPGELLFDSNGNRLATPVSNDAKPQFVAPDGIAATSDLPDFQPFYGTSAAAPNAAAVAALMMQANTSLETDPTQVTSLLESSAVSFGLPADEQGAGLVQAVGAVKLAEAACYARGTRLLTLTGDVPVEALAIGDVMISAQGEHRTVQWIGHRRVRCRRHPDPASVWPVRISAGAFAAGVPCRDLLLSPDHAVFLDGVLIPIKHLINGSSIVQIVTDQVEYWHVELERHDILLAEGLPCESYLDTGNRAAFDNAAAAVRLHPNFAALNWENACAELVLAGPRLVAAKQRLFERAAGIGLRRPALALEVLRGRHVMKPVDLGGAAWRYALPPRTRLLHLVSPPWIPASHYAASLDRRTLGVRLLGVAVDLQAIPLDAPGLFEGFHPVETTAEGPSRWTTGRARLVLPRSASTVTLRVGDNAEVSGGCAMAA